MTEFDDYGRTSDAYLENAKELLARGEEQKAGEFLWGAITQAVKALAISRGIEILSHAQLRSFVRDIALTEQDREILDLFRIVEGLHHNFYDREVGDGEMLDYLPKVEALRAKLSRLVTPSSASPRAPKRHAK